MKADLHLHTKYSDDGWSPAAKVVRQCKRRRFGCIAITDHNSFAAYAEVKDDPDIIIIPAEEVSSSEGHIIALGIDREIPKGMGVKETIDAIHEAGGIAIAAHPYRWWSGLGRKNVIPEFDGIEAKNSKSTPGANYRSKKLAQSFGKMVTAGSDAHNRFAAGWAYVIISDDCRTWQDVIEEIKAGRVEVRGISRYVIGTIYYVMHSVFAWMFRGFRKM